MQNAKCKMGVFGYGRSSIYMVVCLVRDIIWFRKWRFPPTKCPVLGRDMQGKYRLPDL